MYERDLKKKILTTNLNPVYFHSQMTEKTNQPAKFMKNVCAVSNFVQVLLMQGYGFDEHSLPTITFQKKVRSKGNNIYVCHRQEFQFVYPNYWHLTLSLSWNQEACPLCVVLLFQCLPCFVLQAGGASVGWALGCMLNQSSMVPEERPGLMKALPTGPWAGVLFLFITLLFIALGYTLMIYRDTRAKEDMV